MSLASLAFRDSGVPWAGHTRCSAASRDGAQHSQGRQARAPPPPAPPARLAGRIQAQVQRAQLTSSGPRLPPAQTALPPGPALTLSLSLQPPLSPLVPDPQVPQGFQEAGTWAPGAGPNPRLVPPRLSLLSGFLPRPPLLGTPVVHCSIWSPPCTSQLGLCLPVPL